MRKIKYFILHEISKIDYTFGEINTILQLREMLKIKIPIKFPKSWRYSERRETFNNGRFLKKQIGNICVICSKESFLDRHHIIPMQNGGLSIKENIIGICRECHESIHGFSFNFKQRIEREE